MRRTSLTIVGAFWFSAVCGALVGTPAAAVDETQTYRLADRALTAALANGDRQVTASLLDENFQWVEAKGKAHSKTEVLEDLASFSDDNENPIDVRTLDLLGSVERVLGMHHNQRFAHIWVKRISGWQAFLFLDIPIPAERAENLAPPKPPADADKVCDNPCKTLPYKPQNAAQEGAIAAWFHLKNDEWHPNPEDWDAHADAFHETLSPQNDLPKLQHIAELAEERKLYGENGGSAGAPVQSMRMFDFGNVVVMEALHAPTGAEKPTTWVVRVFINRGDGWKIVLSAQTSIKNQ